jgi:hypothetical protein
MVELPNFRLLCKIAQYEWTERDRTTVKVLEWEERITLTCEFLHSGSEALYLLQQQVRIDGLDVFTHLFNCRANGQSRGDQISSFVLFEKNHAIRGKELVLAQVLSRLQELLVLGILQVTVD